MGFLSLSSLLKPPRSISLHCSGRDAVEADESGGSGGMAGNVLHWNNDDDDANGVEDRLEGSGPLGFDDDDLEPAILKVDEESASAWVASAAGGAEGHLAGVKLELSYDANKLRVWRTPKKEPLDDDEDPDDGVVQFEFTSDGCPSGVPSEIYVEGYALGTGYVTWKLIAPTDEHPSGEVVASDKVKFTVFDLKLYWVTFGDEHEITEDPGGTGQVYSSQHWLDTNQDGDAIDAGEHQWPVAYTRGSTMRVRACFKLGATWPGGQILVWADGPGSVDVAPTAASGGGTTVTTNEVSASGAFPNQVHHYDDFVLKWQASVDGGATWVDAGTSSNDLYLTWDDPEVDPLYHTVVHLGSHYAAGATTQNDVVLDVWNNVFSNHTVGRVVDGMDLWYYHDYGIQNDSTEKLLTPISTSDGTLGDGKCAAWVDLMSDVLKAQGVTSHSRITVVPDSSVISPAPEGFLVNEWSFSGTGSSDAAIVSFEDPDLDRDQVVTAYRYLNVLQADGGAWNDQRNGYEFRFEDVTDGTGIAGKGMNSNPNSIFANHELIEYNTGAETVWFDPSYAQIYQGGTPDARALNFEDGGGGDPAIIAGYDIVEVAKVKESVVGVDINGDKDFLDQDWAAVMLVTANNIGVPEVVVQ